MGCHDGNAIPSSIDSAGIREKSDLELKATKAEDEPAEQISSNESVRSKADELSRKHERESCEETEDVRDGSERCQFSSSETSSDRKRRSGDLSDDPTQKRHKSHVDSNDMHPILNMKQLIADRIDDIQKQERSESSGKRSRDSFDSETGLEGKTLSGDDSISKRRKVWHAGENLQLKMLGPLKLPDYVNGFKYDDEIYEEIIKLNKQLIEINNKLRDEGTIEHCLEDEHSTSPPPIYNEVGIRMNTRVNRLRRKLSHRRQQIICELNQKNPLFLPPLDDKPAKFTRKLYIPVKQYPNYNFIGLIIGPRGHTQKRMERKSGARILLRGKGSSRLRKGKHFKDRKTELFEDEDLHVYIEAEDENSLESASQMVEKLLVPVNEELNEHKQAQLRELAELNSEISSEALNTTNQNHFPCYSHDNERPVTSPLNPTQSEFASKAEINYHKPAPVSFLNCLINSESEELSSHDTKPGDLVDKAKLFVGFLPVSVNTERLIDIFSPFGSLCEAVVIVDRRTGLSKGYGFVKYIDPLSAAEALFRMNGFRIEGKVITVRIAARAPMNINTIIGPRAFRVANPASNLVAATTSPSDLSQGVTKGWNKWVLLPQTNGFPLRADSMNRRPHFFTKFTEQCPLSSLEFVPFTCYQNVAESLD